MGSAGGAEELMHGCTARPELIRGNREIGEITCRLVLSAVAGLAGGLLRPGYRDATTSSPHPTMRRHPVCGFS